MNKTLILVIAVGLLPAYASAAKLDLKQDLGGLDLAVAIEPPPPGDPVAIMITNKSTQLVACTLSYGGVEAGMASAEVTVQPGKSGTVREPVSIERALGLIQECTERLSDRPDGTTH